MSPICLFLAGSSWPTFSFPKFWKLFSYMFPTTFGCKAFINGAVAGGDMSIIGDQFVGMTIQMVVYYFLACLMIHIENRVIKHKDELIELRNKIAMKHGIDLQKDAEIIAGDESVEDYRKRMKKE
jgi:ABC-2 type transport system permease protein